MPTILNFTSALPTINEKNFEDIALQVFHFQAQENAVYSSYLKQLRILHTNIASIDQIPFLPIGFFKTHEISTGSWDAQKIFRSSGTTGEITSRHLVWNLPFYLSAAESTFSRFFGPLSDFHLLALLPSYLEREDSSLIAMISHFIDQTQSEHSGFYLSDQGNLARKLEKLRTTGRKVILWGVSFALLDLAERFEIDLSHCTIIETGGMKGRRKEWIREELHRYLCGRFNVTKICSEYGMTELMSQAYSDGDGLYQSPNWMKILIREVNDPYSNLSEGKVGALNIIDLANAHSCAFIETQDLGKISQNGYFEVLGRMDNTDLRGCNLLVG